MQKSKSKRGNALKSIIQDVQIIQLITENLQENIYSNCSKKSTVFVSNKYFHKHR